MFKKKWHYCTNNVLLCVPQNFRMINSATKNLVLVKQVLHPENKWCDVLLGNFFSKIFSNIPSICITKILGKIKSYTVQNSVRKLAYLTIFKIFSMLKRLYNKIFCIEFQIIFVLFTPSLLNTYGSNQSCVHIFKC